jgi:hypothetical protein
MPYRVYEINTINDGNIPTNGIDDDGGFPVRTLVCGGIIG